MELGSKTCGALFHGQNSSVFGKVRELVGEIEYTYTHQLTSHYRSLPESVCRCEYDTYRKLTLELHK